MTKARDIADGGQTINTSNFVTKDENGAIEALDGSALTNLTSGNLTGALPNIDGSSLTGIVAGGTNTPAFFAYRSSNQQVSAGQWNRADLNAKTFDTDSAFDEANTFRFTVPAGEGGKYFFFGQVGEYHGASIGITAVKTRFYVNGSVIDQTLSSVDTGHVEFHEVQVGTQAILELQAGDYVELYGLASNAAGTSEFNPNTTRMGCFKLAE